MFFVFNNSRCVPEIRVGGLGILIPLTVVLLVFIISTFFLAWKLHKTVQLIPIANLESACDEQVVLYQASPSNNVALENKDVERQVTDDNAHSVEAGLHSKDVNIIESWPQSESVDNCLTTETTIPKNNDDT